MSHREQVSAIRAAFTRIRRGDIDEDDASDEWRHRVKHYYAQYADVTYGDERGETSTQDALVAAVKRLPAQKPDSSSPTRKKKQQEQPKAVTGGKMKDYQIDGLDWMLQRWKEGQAKGSGGGVLLCDEMGLGKTLQTISLIAQTKAELEGGRKKQVQPVLVVCPLSVVQAWADDCKRFCPDHVRVLKYIGTREERDAIVDLAVTSLVHKARTGASATTGAATAAAKKKAAPVERSESMDILLGSIGGDDDEEEEDDVPAPVAGAGEEKNGGDAHWDFPMAHQYDVVVTTPELLLSERFFLKQFNWRMLVLDEAHRFKNPHSKSYINLMIDYDHVRCHRVLLTGTPLHNTPLELVALLNLANPDLFRGMETHATAKELVELNAKKGSPVSNALATLGKHFILRRLKVDVLKDLPPIKEVILHCPLSPLQRRMYIAALNKDLGALLPTAGGGVDAPTKAGLMNTVMQLRKICNHPYMFPGVEKPPFELGEHLVTHSAKLAYLDKLLTKLRSEGHRVLIFSQFTHVLDILQDYLDYRDWDCERLDGSVRGEERFSAVTSFQTDRDKFIFLLSTRAGGVGLTLTGADTVIFFDSDWNPQMDLQAQQRAHRIGQERPVTVYRLVTKDTVEDAILLRAQKKLTMADSILKQTGAATATGKGADSKETASNVKEILLFAAAAVTADAADDDEADDATPGKKVKKKKDSEEKEKAAEARWQADLKATTADNILGRGKRVNFTEAITKISDDVYVFEGEAYDLKVAKGGAFLVGEEARATAEGRVARGGLGALGGGQWGADDLDALMVVKKAPATERERIKKLKTKWSKAGYTSKALHMDVSLYDEGEGKEGDDAEGEEKKLPLLPDLEEDDEDDDDEGAGTAVPKVKGGVFHAVGDATNPPIQAASHANAGAAAAPTTHRQLLIVPVNNLGSWHSGGMFKALSSLYGHGISKQYADSKDQADLRYGDAHCIQVKLPPGVILPPTAEDGTVSVLVERHVVLCVALRSTTTAKGHAGEVDLKHLEMCISRIKSYIQVNPSVHFSLHFPQLGGGDKGVGYGVDKVIKNGIPSNVRSTVYYFRRSGGGGGGHHGRRERDTRTRSPPRVVGRKADRDTSFAPPTAGGGGPAAADDEAEYGVLPFDDDDGTKVTASAPASGPIKRAAAVERPPFSYDDIAQTSFCLYGFDNENAEHKVLLKKLQRTILLNGGVLVELAQLLEERARSTVIPPPGFIIMVPTQDFPVATTGGGTATKVCQLHEDGVPVVDPTWLEHRLAAR